MGNKNRKGLWISIEILEDKNLDAVNKIILAEIYSLCELPKGCIAGDQHLGELVNLSRTAINSRIKLLEGMGYFEKTVKPGVGKILKRKNKNNKLSQAVLETNQVENIFNPTPTSSITDTLPVSSRTPTSSITDTINTTTNTDLLEQEIIQYTGATKNSGLSMNQLLNNRFEELVFDLVNKTSLGEGIFIYTEPGNLDMFRDAVDEEEYKLVYPLLTSIIDVEKKLYGN
jgi:biotin operon repressor